MMAFDGKRELYSHLPFQHKINPQSLQPEWLSAIYGKLYQTI